MKNRVEFESILNYEFKLARTTKMNILNMSKNPKNNPNSNVLAFASPSLTPQNNYKKYSYLFLLDSVFDTTKEVNSSLILGRKIDSP